MNPAFLDRMSWEMAEVYGAITDRILINLARYFPYMTAGHIPRSAFDYQAKMLAQMGKVNRESMQIIRDGLQGADRALARVLEQSIIDSIRKTEPELLDAVKAGIFKPAGIPIVAPNQMQAFSLYYHQAAQKLNLVNTVMLESTRQAYQATVSDVVSRVQATQTALDIGAGETLTGVSSWNMAMRHAIDRMKDNGITGFIDHAGRKWSAEAYAAMDIRTTVANTARAAVWEQNQNFGNDLYIVSYHDGARPLCYPWQNKVISSLNQARTVVDLDGNEIQVIAQSDTSYGDPGGLFGINCKHYPSPFIPGVSVLYDKTEIPSEKENEKLYEQTQQQRALERDLREKKRDLLIEKARGADKETLDVLRSRCREASDEIDRFCDETGLPRRQNREGVFTKRDFPDADTYDVTAFERKQKERIERYFDRGGAQNGYTFNNMTPNVPLVPNPPAVSPQETTGGVNYGKPFDMLNRGYRSPQVRQFNDARTTLENAPEVTRKAWEKVADDLNHPTVDSSYEGAYYSPSDKHTHFKTYKEAFEESGYQRKNVCFFHEYGHNIDDLLGGKGNGYLSTSYVNADGKMFSQVLEREIGDTLSAFYLKGKGVDVYDAVKEAQNEAGGMGFGSYVRQMLRGFMPKDEYNAIRQTLIDSGDDDTIFRPLVDKWLKPQFQQELRDIVKQHKEVADGFINWVKDRYSIYERSDVSDIFGNYMTRFYGKDYAYPFGIGHKVSYQMNFANMPKEAFAEFFSATVTQCDSLKGIQDLLPESYQYFMEMLGDAVK